MSEARKTSTDIRLSLGKRVLGRALRDPRLLLRKLVIGELIDKRIGAAPPRSPASRPREE